MKIVSVVFFALALSGTWMLAHSKKPVAESVHVGIQNDLKRIITEYVQKNLPASKNLRFQKFWTETLNDKKVKAYFLYSFEDTTEEGEPAEVEIDGSAVLNKIEDKGNESIWSFDELQILDSKVAFSEPIQIISRAGELEKPAPRENTEKKENH